MIFCIDLRIKKRGIWGIRCCSLLNNFVRSDVSAKDTKETIPEREVEINPKRDIFPSFFVSFGIVAINSLEEMETRGKVIDFKQLTRAFRARPASLGRKTRGRVEKLSDVRLRKKRLGDCARNMKVDRKRKRDETQTAWRTKKKRRTIAGKVVALENAESDVNGDAAKYLHHFNSKTCMWNCGVCGSEEGECDLKLLDDVMNVVTESDMPILYAQVLQSVRSAGSMCSAYFKCIESEFSELGLLKDARHVCNACLKVLRKGRRGEGKDKKVEQGLEWEEVGDDDDDSVVSDDTTDSNEGNIYQSTEVTLNVPSTAYLCGLYPGIVPLELRDLRTVEMSMISLYNPITRLRLNCKGVSYKYFHGHANTYTIVNDVTKVASALPLLPSVHTFAILKYTNDVCVRELKYRPGVVRRALTWLKANNHLYKDVPVHYPEEWSALDMNSEIEPECMIIDEEEEAAIQSEPVTNNQSTHEHDDMSDSCDSSCDEEENDVAHGKLLFYKCMRNLL